MCPSKPPPLLRGSFSAAKSYAPRQHAVENDQHLVYHRHNRAFLASPWRQLLKPRLEYGAPFSRCRPCALYQCGAPVGVPMCRLTTFLNTGAFSIARAQSGPARRLLGCGKRCQIGPCLGEDDGEAAGQVIAGVSGESYSRQPSQSLIRLETEQTGFDLDHVNIQTSLHLLEMSFWVPDGTVSPREELPGTLASNPRN